MAAVSSVRRLVTAAVCAFSVLSAGYAALQQDSTYDEPFHLGWSERLWDTGVAERTSQERYNSKTPATIPNVLARKAARSLGVDSQRLLLFAARLPSVICLAVLLAAIFAAVRRIAGEPAAHWATLIAALDPNLVAHGSLATVDLPYALATFVTLLAAVHFAGRPSLARAAAVGAALGLAFAVKFTAVLLCAGLLLTPLAARGEACGFWRRPGRVAACALTAIVAAAAVVDLAYLGSGVGARLAEAQLESPILGRVAAAAPGLRLPLPVSFLQGLDRSIGSERGWGPIVLLGRLYPDGAPHYFVTAWALKTPLGLLLLLAAGIGLLLRSRAIVRDPALRFLALNAVLALAYFSFLFKTQIGYRFVLMCVPLACVLAAAGLAPVIGRRAFAAVCAALLFGFAEGLPYLGNPLSFTNAAVWPKRLAFRLLADSNLDWGQHDDTIARWAAEHGVPAARIDPVHVLAGANVLSVNDAAGVFDFEQHRWLREHADPERHIGHTHLLFDVDAALFERFMDEERSLAPTLEGERLCPATLAYTRENPGAQLAFVRDEPPTDQRVWVACVRAPRGSDIGFRVRSGRIRAGVMTPVGSCDASLLDRDQVVWRRLSPGTHPLCVVEVPNRRAFLPYRVEASWIVRGRAAHLNVRPLATGSGGAVQP
jgi:hypothetical protein